MTGEWLSSHYSFNAREAAQTSFSLAGEHCECFNHFLQIGYSTCQRCTHIAQRRATVVPNLSKRNPLASVRKLFMKEAMVKTSENCSSCPLQSVDTWRKGEKLDSLKSRFEVVVVVMRRKQREVRMWHWPRGCVAFTPVALTHRELKKPSVFRTKTSEAHPNTAPAKHRHSTRPEAKVRPYFTLMVPRHSPKSRLPSSTCTDDTLVGPEWFFHSVSMGSRKVNVNFLLFAALVGPLS